MKKTGNEEYNMNLKVVKFTQEHLEESVDLFIDVFTNEPWNDEFSSRQKVVDFFYNHINNNYFLGYTGFIDSQIVATSLGMKKPWIKGMEYYIDSFCVARSYQNKGIGSLFLKEIEKDMNKEDVFGFMLNTDKKYPAFSFYLKNGFEEYKDLVILVK